MIMAPSPAEPRKLARNGGQQASEMQEEQAIDIDGRPSSGYGDHVCPRSIYPSCRNRLEQTASNNLG
ncbi:hypothetical protein QOZ80_4BG0353920 [Eleusine coracana subsp. coracana]|nr:hypothetical protein QOZ80_4BG0353920 [Eleusine coracana subsp. coracana]